MLIKALVLVGPTGVGKTDLALELAEDKFEIISVDSVQVYKYFDVGSGKPNKKDLKKVKHYLIDEVEPDYNFTAGVFCQRASLACQRIVAHKKIPFFVGGTGLYLDSFFQGLNNIPEVNPKIRRDLEKELEKHGLDYLYKELKRVDSVWADKISSGDKQRTIRGLEVFRSTGHPLSSYYKEKKGLDSQRVLFLGLDEDREVLRIKIENRVDQMLKQGFVEEVQSLRDRGYSSSLKSMKSIGYAELNSFLDKKISLLEAVAKIKTATKRYAKRQRTWFRRNKNIIWYKKTDIKKLKERLNHWLAI